MNWAEFKDPVSHMCLAGAVAVSWPLAQDMAGSSPSNDTFLSNLVKTFGKDSIYS